jgi:hypothetical protein
MKVTSLREETNDGSIFGLVTSGGVKAYGSRLEKHMVVGVNGPCRRGKIIGPVSSFIHVPDVISEK